MSVLAVEPSQRGMSDTLVLYDRDVDDIECQLEDVCAYLAGNKTGDP
jgi:hypothetical protein